MALDQSISRRTLFCALGLILTFVGIFFRGPGYSFVIPYVTTNGLHFSL